MGRWLFHLVFEPISAWEQFKITLILLPLLLLFAILWWLAFTWWTNRTKGKR